MKIKMTILLAAVFMAVFIGEPSRAQLSALETEHLRLIYFETITSYLAPHAARCFENSFKFHRRLWNYETDEKITVFMVDFTDYGNAGAKNVPENMIIVDIAPFSYAYETIPANERINTIMNHELVHIAAMDRAAGRDNFFRQVFRGKVSPTTEHPLTIVYDYLATPRRSAPRWFHEGIAVFMETWMSGGFGRVLGSYDEMVFRTMVRDSARFYDPIGLESEGTAVDFHVGVNSYLYGARFFSYLAYNYGPEKLIEWVSRTDGSAAYFVGQFRKVYGTPLNDEWDRWIDWEGEFQQINLDSIRQYPVTDYRPLSMKGLGSLANAFCDGQRGKLYTAVNYPGTIAHIAAIDLESGNQEKITDMKGPALFFVSSLAYDSLSGSLFYTTDNYSWRDIVVVDVESGDKRVLLKDARIGDLTYNYKDSSLWGMRHSNGISTIVRMPFPYDKWHRIYSLPYGRDMYDINISSDGRLLSAALVKPNGWQSLVIAETENLLGGDTTFTELYDFGNSNPASFVFSPDGRYLFGSSYYTGVSNIFRYDLETDSMEAVSNCETGFFRPIPLSSDSLIVFSYTGKGFVPAKIAFEPLEDISAIRYLGQMVVDEHPLVKEWMAGSPSGIDLDSMTVFSGEYNALTSMRPVSLYPVVEGYRHYTAAGVRINFADPLAMHKLNLAVSITPSEGIPNDQRWHARATYSRMNWKARFKYNAADFYDLFGPTKTSRKGYSLGLSYHKSLAFDEPKMLELGAGVTGYGGLVKLPDYQNIVAPYDKFLSANISLSYSNQSTSLGAVDYEKGISCNLTTSSTYVSDKIHSLTHTEIDLGFPLFYHSSFWIRSSFGYSPGRKLNSFANFYFGGFGNNWIDYQYEKRYRYYYSFPGVELNAINGTNYGKVMLEWNLPPLRFRHIGGPALYCTWARLALFSTGIVTNMASDLYRREVGNLGGQLDFRFQLLSHLRLTFSIGYAASFEDRRKPDDEVMVSLKLL